MKRTFTSLLFLFMGMGLTAQSADLAQAYLQKNFAEFGLSGQDVADLRVSDAYPSPDGVEHIYLAQYFSGIPVFSAQAILHFRGRQLVSKQIGGLAKGLASFNLPTAPAFSAHKAIFTAANAVAPAFGRPIFKDSQDGEQQFVWPAVSPEPLTAQLVYLKVEKGVKLAWRVLIDQYETDANHYLIMVDATDGSILATDNLVLSCDFGVAHQHDLAANCSAATPKVASPNGVKSLVVADGATYNVIPFGEESPIHSERRFEVNPADSVASPFGWHDTDGVEGAEFTITRGNNVYAYPDREQGVQNNDNTPDGQTAEGGAELFFDFPFTPGGDLDSILEASMVQSFYTVNKMHDWLFHAGFNEAAGNFQETNYQGGGRGGDPVNAEAQDGTSRGNANFSTPADGSSPRMQMMIFDGPPSVMKILEPSRLDRTYTTGTADFGPDIALNGPYEGNVVRALDNSANPTLGCNAIANAGEVSGNIALITRGDCFFIDKVLNAQDAGAIGVIICNNVEGLINMTGTVTRPVTIPSLTMQIGDCVDLNAALAAGETVRVRMDDFTTVTDSDFDAGIVAHEFGHGVSNRLVGGPSQVACLRNDEQMGEGWSDFFTLASTPQTILENPDGTEARGIGNYAISAAITGGGIRTQPYSTDATINNKTYNDIIYTGFDQAPHPVGEVWAAALWDIYWYYTNKLGFDDDLINGTGGNNKAVQLVVEGMKYTECNPTMLDARNGILEANRIVFAGEDQCDLYQIFADRGMGFSAEEGSSDDRTDNRGGNDLTPYCTGDIRMSMEVDVNNIDAGEVVGYTVRVFSYREETVDKSQISVTLPDGMELDINSVDDQTAFTVAGNVITFDIAEIDFEEEIIIRFDVTTDESIGATSYFFDGAELDDDNWDLIDTEGDFIWQQTDTTPYSGELSWYVINAGADGDQSLQLFEPVTVEGDRPGLRFFTKYQTEAGWDAGIVEISTDNSTWNRIPTSKLLRGAYRGEVAPTATEALRGDGSFWGDSEGFQEIIADLSEFEGEDIYFRFRFISDANTNGVGWWVDDIELVDLVNYDVTATLTTGAGDVIEAEVGDLGVVPYNAVMVNTVDAQLGLTTVKVFPNPAGAIANVRITTERAGAATVQLLTIDGRSVYNEKMALLPGANVTEIATDRLPAGIYMVQVTGADRVSTTKLTIR